MSRSTIDTSIDSAGVRDSDKPATAADPQVRPYGGPQAWYGPEMSGRSDWIHEFSASELAEIDAAVQCAQASGREIIDIGKRDFPLTRIVPLLDAVRKEVLHGRGFALFRGIPVERYTLRQSAIAYWGLGLYFGEAVSQNGKGHLLGHVTNLGLDYADPEVRGYQTNAGLNYHCDSSDIVSLLCLRTSKSGGASSIVSSTTLWNEILRTRPDLAQALMQPFFYTRWGEIPEGRKPYSEVPVFEPCNGRMIGVYVRSAINKAQLMPLVPRLTPRQIEAIDYLDRLAADPRLHLAMTFRPGDIQLLCNHSILHSRTAYEDWPEIERRRHLLRLWLACEDGPTLPAHFTENYQGRTARGRPDGIRVPGVPLVASLDPLGASA